MILERRVAIAVNRLSKLIPKAAAGDLGNVCCR
jgi:hypothetical protein